MHFLLFFFPKVEKATFSDALAPHPHLQLLFVASNSERLAKLHKQLVN